MADDENVKTSEEVSVEHVKLDNGEEEIVTTITTTEIITEVVEDADDNTHTSTKVGQQVQITIPAATPTEKNGHVPADAPQTDGIACKLAPASKYYTTNPEEAVLIRFGETEFTSKPAITVMELFERTVKKFPTRTAMRTEKNNEWVTWTYEEYLKDIRTAAKGFVKLGLKPYHTVSILGFNAPEWLISDLGAIYASGLAAGIYATSTPDACAYILKDSRTNIAVVEHDAQLQKILQVWDRLPELKAIIQYKGELKEKKENVYTWEEFMKIGSECDDKVVDERIAMQAPNRGCTLVYTSGTTGNPKGVMLSHDNVTYEATVCHRAVYKWCGQSRGEVDSFVSFLPLSHIAAQCTDIYAPIIFAGYVSFARPDALKGSLGETLRACRPTLLLGVPRVFEKMQEKLITVGQSIGGAKKKLAGWAKDIGLRGNMNKEEGRPVPYGWTLANALVLKKVRARLGLDRCQLLFTAGAPISLETLRYFQSLNIPLYEIYGMSECTGAETITMPDRVLSGSVGPVCVGTELVVVNKDADGSGELCFRGRHVFMGYVGNEEKTKEALDEDGLLHSGDVGTIDKNGFVFITGRIKELLITAGGENIAPVPIEDCIKAEIPLLSNVMAIGDRRKFLAAFLTVKTVMDSETGAPTEDLHPQAITYLKSIGVEASKVADIIPDTPEAVKKAIQEAIDRANEKAVSRAAKIQKWKLLEKDFSVDGGELGPTLKLRRPHVVKMYKDEIEAFYAE